MRLAVTLAVVVVMLSAGGGGDADGLPPGPAHLSLQASLVSKRQVGHFTTAAVYRLYNKPSYKGQVGMSALICVRVASAWRNCTDYLRLASGQLIATALVPAAATFLNLAVIGGTGIYSNAGGTVTLQPIDANTQVVVGTIEAF